MNQTNEYTHEEMRAAKNKAKNKVGFLVHLMVYIFVNLLLLVINLITSPGYLWFWWSAIFWGFALLIQFIFTFIVGDLFNNLEQSLVDDELRKIKK